MLVAEVLLRKLYTQDKINELNSYMTTISSYNIKDKGKLYSSVLTQLFDLHEQLQKYSLIIKKSNSVTEISIGDAIFSVDDAVRFNKTLENKIESLTGLIKMNDITLDIFQLVDQRDKLLEDYFNLVSAIRKSDWVTEVE